MGSQSAELTERLTARFTTTERMAAYDVVNAKGQDLGQVHTFIVDMKEGLIAFALVTIGGTLGFGDKWFALPWGALKWDQKTSKFILDMPEEILKNALGMDKDKWREDIVKWREEEDLAVIDRYYGTYGYESYQGIVRLISGRRGRQPTIPAPTPSMVTEQQIKELAYATWDEEGRPEGKDLEHYFRAEKILEGRQASSHIESAPSQISKFP